MIKIRSFPEHNYKAIFHNGKTLRLQYDTAKDIDELEYPEFMDIAINSLCFGSCPYCYVSATRGGKNYVRVLDKIDSYFGSLSENQRPFQVAIGGAGEPTLHPKFPQILQKFYELGIMPNYTTNGMHLSSKVMAATRNYSGGVAVTCHPHLEKHWRRAIETLLRAGVRTNLHIIISDRASYDNFLMLYEEYSGRIDYFVLLPYQAVGRATPMDIDFEDFFSWLENRFFDFRDIAFGALFYEYLKDKPWLDVSLYEPESMSKYLDMDEMILYPSSFDLTPIRKVV